MASPLAIDEPNPIDCLSRTTGGVSCGGYQRSSDLRKAQEHGGYVDGIIVRSNLSPPSPASDFADCPLS